MDFIHVNLEFVFSLILFTTHIAQEIPAVWMAVNNVNTMLKKKKTYNNRIRNKHFYKYISTAVPEQA